MPKFERKDPARLLDMRRACELLVDFTRHKKFPDFVSDLVLQSAVLHQLSVLGEASKNVSKPTQKKFPNVPWSDLSRYRDRSAHGYWTIDDAQVWHIVKNDIPSLLTQLEDL